MTSALNSDKHDKALPRPGRNDERRFGARGSADRSSRAVAAPFRQPPVPVGDWLATAKRRPGQPVVLMHQTALLQVVAHSRSDTQLRVGRRAAGPPPLQNKRDRWGSRPLCRPPAPITAQFISPSRPTRGQSCTATAPPLQQPRHYRLVPYPPPIWAFYSSDDVVVHSAAFTFLARGSGR